MKNNWAFLMMFWALAASAELVDKTVASVDKEIILKSDVDSLLANQTAGFHSSKDALEALIGKEAMAVSCKQSGNYPEEAEIKQTINEIKRQNNITDDKVFLQALRLNLTNSTKTTDEEILKTYKKQVAGEICRNRTIYGKIRGRINITDDDIQRAYIAQYGPDSTRKLHLRDMRFLTPADQANIVPRAQEAADTALRNLSAGSAWDKVLKEAKKSGVQVVSEDLGFLTRKDLLASIADAVFTDDAGDLRGPVRTDDGIHVIKITEREEGEQIPLAQVKNDLHKQILDQETERLLRQYVEEAKSSIYIDVMGV